MFWFCRRGRIKVEEERERNGQRAGSCQPLQACKLATVLRWAGPEGPHGRRTRRAAGPLGQRFCSRWFGCKSLSWLLQPRSPPHPHRVQEEAQKVLPAQGSRCAWVTLRAVGCRGEVQTSLAALSPPTRPCAEKPKWIWPPALSPSLPRALQGRRAPGLLLFLLLPLPPVSAPPVGSLFLGT